MLPGHWFSLALLGVVEDPTIISSNSYACECFTMLLIMQNKHLREGLRESDSYCFLGYPSSFSCFHAFWFKSKCSCLSWSSTESQGGYLVQGTMTVDQTSSSFAWQCCHNHESLELLELGNSSTSTIVLIWHHQTPISSQIRKSTSEVSASILTKMFEMKSRMVLCQGQIFFLWRAW
jgi:hypothetical protein